MNSPVHSKRQSSALVAILTLVALLLPLLFINSCSQSPTIPLRLAINLWPSWEFLYLANEKGFFASEGIEVQFIEVSTLNDCRSAFESGHVNAMGVSLIEILETLAHSELVPQIALVTDYSNGADVILARKEINSVAGLKGRTIGLELGTLSIFVLSRALERAGLNINDVKILSCIPGEMRVALEAGQVDAVVTYPPNSLAIEPSNAIHRLFSSAEVPGELPSVVAVEASHLLKNPTLPSKLTRIFQRAIDYTRDNPDEAYAAMSRREGISPAEFVGALKGIELVGAQEQVLYLGPQGALRRTLADTEQVLLKSGHLTRTGKTSRVFPNP